MNYFEHQVWELSADLLNAFILSVDNLRPDLIVVMEFHTEWDKERMRYELFVPSGNMLKEKFKPESYFDVLLFTDVAHVTDAAGNEVNKYRFVTKSTSLYPQARGSDLFGDDVYVDNNLEMVLTAFRKNILNESIDSGSADSGRTEETTGSVGSAVQQETTAGTKPIPGGSAPQSGSTEAITPDIM